MTSPADTLVLDSALISRWRADGVDFTQEFTEEHQHKQTKTHTSSDWNIDKWVQGLLPNSDTGKMIGALILAAMVVATLVILSRKKFEAPAQRLTLDPDEEDTIYGVDFAAALRSAEEEHNYVQCIRLRYLQLLRLLHDRQMICWQPGKTSTQYIDEVNLEPFTALTQTFVRVRYGKYPADELLYADMARQATMVEQQIGTTHERKEAEA